MKRAGRYFYIANQRILTRFKMSGVLDSFIASVAFFMRACIFLVFQFRYFETTANAPTTKFKL